MSIFYFMLGFTFFIAAAGAVDGTAHYMWVAINGIIGILFCIIGIIKQENE